MLHMLRLKVAAAAAGVLSIGYGPDREVMVRFRQNLTARQIAKAALFAERLRIHRDRLRIKRDGNWQEMLLEVLASLAT